MPGGSTIGISLDLGFEGSVSRGGGLYDDYARPVRATDLAPIYFGDACFLNQDSTNGSFSSLASLLLNNGTIAGTTTSTSTSMTGVTPTTGIAAGQQIVGPGIPAGTTVSSFSGSTITLSQAATASGAGVFSVFAGNASFANFSGFAKREVKSTLTYPYNASIYGMYPQGTTCTVRRLGDITKKCWAGTPIAGGPVWLRLALNGSVPSGVVGGLEAAADGGYSIKLNNVQWTTGLMDSNGIAEVTLMWRNI